MNLPLWMSLLAVLLYAHILGVLLLTRQESPLLGVVVCGCTAFSLAAYAARRRGRGLLCALHGLVAVVSAALFVVLLVP